MSHRNACPGCGTTASWVVRGHALKCMSCRKERPRSPSRVVPGFSFSRHKWLSLIDCFLRDGTGTALAAEERISPRTGYKVISAIQHAMADDDVLTFSGTVEVDCTYIGGEWANKRIHIRRKGTKRGRGTRKTCVFGLVMRGGDARVWIVQKERRSEVEPIILGAVERNARICSDDCPAYGRLIELGYRHESVNHHTGEYVRGDVHTQTLDGLWGGLKNFLAAKGGVRPAHQVRFISEYVWRYNHRSLSRKEQALKIYDLLR
jgi:hypothetical protein